MKISVNDVELFTLSDTQKKVIMDYLPASIFDQDMKRRLQWVLMHLYEQAFIQFKQRNEPLLLANKVESMPTDPDKFAELVFAQPNYQDRESRDGGGDVK
jgi:hypothetical protein